MLQAKERVMVFKAYVGQCYARIVLYYIMLVLLEDLLRLSAKLQLMQEASK